MVNIMGQIQIVKTIQMKQPKHKLTKFDLLLLSWIMVCKFSQLRPSLVSSRRRLLRMFAYGNSGKMIPRGAVTDEEIIVANPRTTATMLWTTYAII